MNEKLRKVTPVFILVYFLIIVPLVSYYYSIYLQKPDRYTWDKVKKYLIISANYNKEPIIFNPEWLKNYATDYDRFQEFNVPSNGNILKKVLAADNFPAYWLISLDKKSAPDNCQIIKSERISNLFIRKIQCRFAEN